MLVNLFFLPANEEQRPVSDAFFSALAWRSGASLAADGATRRAGLAATTGRAIAATGRQALRANDMRENEENEIKLSFFSRNQNCDLNFRVFRVFSPTKREKKKKKRRCRRATRQRNRALAAAR